MFCINGGAVSWKSSKQDTVADSTTEAEYIAASSAAKEAVWIRNFITELGVTPRFSKTKRRHFFFLNNKDFEIKHSRPSLN